MTAAGGNLAQRTLAAVVGRTLADQERLSPSQWAERHYRITDETGAAMPGPFRFSVTPYLRAPVNAFADPAVNRIVIKKREQVGGSEASIIMALYALSGADAKPGNAFWIWSNKDNAGEFNTKRFRYAMEACEPVARHISGRKAHARTHDVTCNGRTIWFRGAPPNEGGVRTLESWPARIIFNDELDRCDVNTPAVMLGRSSTFKRTFKHVFIGTPGDADEGIDRLYNTTAGGGLSYWVPCPFCDAWFVRDFYSGVRWLPGERGGPLDADPEAVRKQAWYVCPRCEQAIHAHHSRDMLAKGVWAPGWSEDRPARVQVEERKAQLPPQEEIDAALHAPSVGFAIGEFENPFQPNPYGEIAAEFVENRGEETRDWMTRRRGKAWRVTSETMKSTTLLRLCKPVGAGGYRFGVVPHSTSVLVGAIDVQGDRVYVLVNGFTPHMRRSWKVWSGMVKFTRPGGVAENFELVREIVERVFVMERAPGGADGVGGGGGGVGMKVSAWAIDSGYETEVVYALCRKLGGYPRMIYAVKGAEGDAASEDPKFKGLDLDAAGKPLPKERQTLMLGRINTWRWKDWVLARLQAAMTRGGGGGVGMAVAGFDEEGDGGGGGGGGDDLGSLATMLMFPEASIEQGLARTQTSQEQMRQYFESLTSEEKRIKVDKTTGRKKRAWVVKTGTEGAIVGNHYLDLTVYVHYLATRLCVPTMKPPPEGRVWGKVPLDGSAAVKNVAAEGGGADEGQDEKKRGTERRVMEGRKDYWAGKRRTNGR